MIKFVKPILYGTLIALTVFSCKVGETYKRPDLEGAGDYYRRHAASDSSAVENSIAKIKWREFFGDSVLISLIDSTLMNNIGLRKTGSQREIALLMLTQSRANFYPSLGVSPMRYTREYYSQNYNNYGSNRSRRNHPDSPPTSFYTENLSYATTLQASWEIDIWGKFKWQEQAAQAEFIRTNEFKKALQTALVAEVSSTYYYMLMLNTQIAISKRNLELTKRTLRIVKLQFDADETTSLAIRQTQAQMLRAQALIPQLEKEYAIQENRLNRLMGQPPQPLNIRQDLDYVTFESQYGTGVPLELINNRPDIAASEYRLIAANARVGIAQAMKYPSITIGGGVGLNSFEFRKFLDPLGSGFALVNGAVFQPIFQNRKLKTNHKIAIAEREMAELDFKDKFITAVTEVSDAIVTIEKLREQYTVAQEYIDVTGKGIRDASLLFQSGFANYLEIINAQEDALQSEMDLANLKMQLLLANIELYRSLGGGWQ